MFRHLILALRRVAACLSLALLAQGSAHAGLVSGEWDPQFGPALPNLSWQVRTQWLVPNACSDQLGDNVYSTSAAGPCQSTLADPVRLLAVWVRWFDTDLGNPTNFFEFDTYGKYTGWCENSFAASSAGADCNLGNTYFFNQGAEPLTATQVRVAQQQVVGFDTNLTSFSTFGSPASAGTHQYDLSFTTNGPIFTCADCDPPATSQPTDLNQFLVTYTSNDRTVAKFTDSQGNALGVRLDSAGNVIPEPAVPVLVLTALAALGWSRRRTA